MKSIRTCSITPLLNSYYLNVLGEKNISNELYKSLKDVAVRSKRDVFRRYNWYLIKYNNQDKLALTVRLRKGREEFLSPKALRGKSATTEKGLEYWKKKLIDILEDQGDDPVEKSLAGILFPGEEDVPDEAVELLVKAARGFPIGTVRVWRGKEYKKVAGKGAKGRWVRKYSEGESRGSKQARRNTIKRILEAKTEDELVEIVRENYQRFQDADGHILPVVKEFLEAARGKEFNGEKKEAKEKKEKKEKKKPTIEKKPADDGNYKATKEEAEKIAKELPPRESVKKYEAVDEGDGNVQFVAHTVDGDVKPIEPAEEVKKSQEDITKEDIETPIDSADYRAYGSWDPEGKHLSAKRRERLNQDIAGLLNKEILTMEDKETLRLYSGFGGTKVANEKGVLYDYYTSPPVAKMVMQMVNKFNPLSGSDKVLEPSCGTGVFFEVLPPGMNDLTGVELDGRTAKVADVLQDRAEIKTGSYEQFNLTSTGDYDVAVGNCPFGKRSVETSFMDQDLDGHGKPIPGEDSLDRYFVSKSIDNLKPGGALGMIAASGLLKNKTNKAWRIEMLRKGQFVGGIQLPNQSFKHSQTGVSPTTYFFKKHSQKDLDKLKTATEQQLKDSGAWNESWVGGTFFDDNPDLRLGDKAKGQFDTEITVGEVTDDILNNAVSNFTPQIAEINTSSLTASKVKQKKEVLKLTEAEAAALQAKTLFVGATKVVNGILYVLNQNHRWERVTDDEDLIKRIPKLKVISKKIQDIRDAMRDDQNPDNLQKEVRGLLDEYQKEFNTLPGNDSSVTKLIKKNAALKGVHEAINARMDSGILTQKNLYDKEVEIVDGHQPEIKALKTIQKTMQKASPEVLEKMFPEEHKDLKDLMRENEDVFIDAAGNYVLKEDFLSGNAWDKIDSLREAIKKEKDKDKKKKMQYGVDALIDARGWVHLEDASISPRDTWIPEKVIQEWATKEFAAQVSRNPEKSGEWTGKPNHHLLSSGYKELIYFLNNKKQRGGSKEENEVNTLNYNAAAQESFSSYIASHEELRDEMEELYNRRYNTELGVPTKTYQVNIDGWDKIKLNSWQWQTIHHLYENGKGISALGTGFGKTYSGVGLMALLRQEGKIKRPLFQVPNNKVGDWVDAIRTAMPNLRIGAVNPEEKGYTNRDKRYQMYQDLANEDWDVIILPESSATEIALPPEEDKKITERVVLDQMKEYKTPKDQQKGLESMLNKISTKEGKNKTITFEDLGVDSIFVDEAHNYKNLFSSAQAREIGLNDGKRSNRALELFKKTEYIRSGHDDKNVFLLTATPLTNSPLEYYNMLSHVAPESLHAMGIKNLDDFVNNFADIELGDDFSWNSPENMGLKKKLKGFRNVRSLQDLFFKYTDYQNDPRAINMPKPDSTKNPNIMPQEGRQVQEIKRIAKEYEIFKKENPSGKGPGAGEKTQNTLTFFAQMRAASLDLELHDPQKFKGWNNPKIEKMVQNAKESYDANGGGQVIFCDRVLSSNKDFNMHDKIKKELIAEGFKEDEIIIVNGLTKSGGKQSETALQGSVSETIDGFNSGKYKVVIGTTGTIGEGVNLQKNSSGLHHLDIPYRPSDVEQRNGRIDRQGNQQKRVELHNYISSGTMDNYSVAKIAGKENWINELLKTKNSVFTNPDGEGIDMDEMMLSIRGEWGEDTTKLKKEVERQRAQKIKDRDKKAVGDVLRKLSLIRNAILSVVDTTTSKYQKMLNQEAKYSEQLGANPQMKNLDLIEKDERVPFFYDTKEGRVLQLGKYYEFPGQGLLKLTEIDSKRGVAVFTYYTQTGRATANEYWSVKDGFKHETGDYEGEITFASQIQTDEEARMWTMARVDSRGYKELPMEQQEKYFDAAMSSALKHCLAVDDGEVKMGLSNLENHVINPFLEQEKVEKFVQAVEKDAEAPKEGRHYDEFDLKNLVNDYPMPPEQKGRIIDILRAPAFDGIDKKELEKLLPTKGGLKGKKLFDENALGALGLRQYELKNYGLTTEFVTEKGGERKMYLIDRWRS